MTKELFVIGCKVIVLSATKKILLLKRSEKSGLGGKWSLPGGAMEKDEDVYVAVQRETVEETGLKLSQLRLFEAISHIKEDSDSAVVLGFYAICSSESVTLNWEHTEYAWLDLPQALALELTSDARRFLESYRDQYA